jgi:hypothetical protein
MTTATAKHYHCLINNSPSFQQYALDIHMGFYFRSACVFFGLLQNFTKSIMKKTFSLLLLFTAFTITSLHAGLVYKSGYVVLLSGDSVKGDIRVNTTKELPMFQKVAVKQGESTKTYKPEQVKEYGFESSRFISRKVDGEMQFLKVLSFGRINLYELQYEEIRGNETVVESEYYIEKTDGSAELQKAKSGKFKKTVAELMADNSELVAKVQDSDKKYEVTEMQQVCDEYNTWYQTQNGSLQGSR